MSSVAGLIILIAIWALSSVPAYIIGARRNVENAWIAFIPLVGPTIAMLWSMGRPAWMFILGIIPLVNIVFGLWLVFTMPAVHGRTRWWGLGLLVPVIGIWAYALTLDDQRSSAVMAT